VCKWKTSHFCKLLITQNLQYAHLKYSLKFEFLRGNEKWNFYLHKKPDTLQKLIMAKYIGNMSLGKEAKIFKVSQDTASRHLKELCDKGFLEVKGSGRSTHYVLKTN